MWLLDRYNNTQFIIHCYIHIYVYTCVYGMCARAQLVREWENVEATTLSLLWAFLSISLFSYVHFFPLVQCFLSMYKITFSYTDSLPLYLLSQICMSKKICMFFWVLFVKCACIHTQMKLPTSTSCQFHKNSYYLLSISYWMLCR